MASFKNLVSTTSAQISSGGTITGDLVINGDLQVSGGGSLSFDEIVQGTQVVEITNTEAFLVRKASDGGDVFIVDTQNSRVGVGGAPSTDVEFFNTASDTASQLAVTSQSSGGNASALILRSNRNDTVGSHTVVTNGQFLGQVLFQGSDGTDYEDAARIFATVDGSPAGDATDMPGALNFATTADGSDSMTTHMKIDNAGNFLFGTTNAYARMYLQSNVVDQTGLLIKHAPASTSTASVGNISADNSNATATNGVLRVHHEDPPANVKMIQVDTTASNTVKFSVDEDGDGFFAGSVGIGIAPAASQKLHVKASSNINFSVSAVGSALRLNAVNDAVDATIPLEINSTNTKFLSNVGVGVTAHATHTDYDALYLGAKGMLTATSSAGSDNVLYLGNNVHRDTDDSLEYIHGDEVSLYSQQNGTHTFFVAGSGNAGDNIAFQRSLNIDNTGNVKVTSDNNVYLSLDSTQTNGDEWQIFNANSGSTSTLQFKNIDQSALVMLMTEAGDVHIGGSNPTKKLEVAGDIKLLNGTNNITVFYGGDNWGQRVIYTTGNMDFFLNGENRFVLDTNSRISLSNNDGGISNTVFGKLAGNALASGGNYNLLMGEDAGNDLTTSDHNVAIGFQTLSKATANLDGNTAIGNYAMGSVVSNDVNNCVALGYNAIGVGVMEAGASGAIAIGMDSLKSLTSGANCIAIGMESMSANTTGQDNISIGRDTLKNLNHANSVRNTAIGNYAGDAMGTLDGNADNIIIGHVAGSGTWATASSKKNIVIGNYAFNGACNQALENVAIGYQALTDITEGDSNVAIGMQSLQNVTTAVQNVAVGSGAGNDITVAGECAILGHNAGSAITDHGRSVFVGHNAGANQEGEQNVFIGKDAGLGASGSNNDGTVAIGFDSLKALTSGQYNVAVGYKSMDATDDGSYNTAVGYTSLSANCGDSNTCIGYASGLLITGSMNVTIGTDAGNSITGGTNNVVIGKGSDTDDATATNQTVVGYATTGVADNSVTLGNNDVTAVYMAQDSGATVHTAGIQFPASQVANGGANVLDDYEEGTFSPAICELADVNDVMTMNGEQAGTYVKIGRLVHLSINAGVSANGSADNSDMAIKNIPFACGGSGTTDRGFRTTFNVSSAGGLNLGSGERLVGFLNATTSLIELRKVGADGNTSQVTRDELSADGGFVMSGTYIADA